MSLAASDSIATAYHGKFSRSAELYQQAGKLLPSGVTHDGRFLKPFPPYVERSSGSKKYTVDGCELIDWWSGHGALLLGHGHPSVVEAVQQQMEQGTHWSACHKLELQWATHVRRLIPAAEMVRFTSSGTEATLMALRLARISTGRRKVLKFAGHFHGWHDQLIPAADPPFTSEMVGVTSSVSDDLIVVRPNDIAAVEQAIETHEPACVILEPTGGHWGDVPIREEFLTALRTLTQEHGVVLIFDEVITGFRVNPGGAQEQHGVTPDLTTLAKVLAGGLPGGCLTGRNELLELLEFDNPTGWKMKHPGTYNANPLSAAAGCAALEQVATGDPCERANDVGRSMRAALNELFEQKSLDWVCYGDFSKVRVFPDYDGTRPGGQDGYIPFNNDFDQLTRDFGRELNYAFRCALLVGGVDWMGWSGMPSAAHTDDDIARTVQAFSQAIDLLRTDGLAR